MERKELMSSVMIKTHVVDLAKRINKDYKGEEVVFIGVLNGAFMFFSDLMKEITLETRIDFIGVNSYREDKIGELVLTKDVSVDLSHKTVIVVDDLLDTGKTKRYISNLLEERGVDSYKWCFLISKEKIDSSDCYIGAVINPELYVYGYGMDLSSKERNLKEIYCK